MGRQIATLTLNKSSQTTIPKVVRDLLGVSFGEKISVETTEDASTLKITREKSLEERLEEIRQKYHTPEQELARKRAAGRPIRELRADWAASPEGQKYLTEKYGAPSKK